MGRGVQSPGGRELRAGRSARGSRRDDPCEDRNPFKKFSQNNKKRFLFVMCREHALDQQANRYGKIKKGGETQVPNTGVLTTTHTVSISHTNMFGDFFLDKRVPNENNKRWWVALLIEKTKGVYRASEGGALRGASTRCRRTIAVRWSKDAEQGWWWIGWHEPVRWGLRWQKKSEQHSPRNPDPQPATLIAQTDNWVW